MGDLTPAQAATFDELRDLEAFPDDRCAPSTITKVLWHLLKLTGCSVRDMHQPGSHFAPPTAPSRREALRLPRMQANERLQELKRSRGLDAVQQPQQTPIVAITSSSNGASSSEESEESVGEAGHPRQRRRLALPESDPQGEEDLLCGTPSELTVGGMQTVAEDWGDVDSAPPTPPHSAEDVASGIEQGLRKAQPEPELDGALLASGDATVHEPEIAAHVHDLPRSERRRQAMLREIDRLQAFSWDKCASPFPETGHLVQFGTQHCQSSLTGGWSNTRSTRRNLSA